MFNDFIGWFKTDIAGSWQIIVTAIGLFAGGVWTALVFFQKVLSEREQKKFDRYRLLIKEINEGRGEDGTVYIDYQLDAVYELRFYPKYYPRIIWLLTRLRERWSKSKTYNYTHIIEIDETIDYIRHRNNLISRICMYFIKAAPLYRNKKTLNH